MLLSSIKNAFKLKDPFPVKNKNCKYVARFYYDPFEISYFKWIVIKTLICSQKGWWFLQKKTGNNLKKKIYASV